MALIAGGALLVATGAAQAQRVPNGHLPPPGECRVWLPDRPAGQQPPPTSCREAERQSNRYGGRVVYGSGEGRGGDHYGNDDRRFQRWALRNYDRNGDGRLGPREYRMAREAYYNR